MCFISIRSNFEIVLFDSFFQAVGVHCRMGRGRTGVMAACYLVRFCNMTPQSAMGQVRRNRPGSIETYSQEEAVMEYYMYYCQRKNS